MLDEILNDGLGILDNVDITPVDPRVLGLQGSTEKVVTGLSHCHSTGTLELKRVTGLNILTLSDTKILPDNGHGVERPTELGVGLVLYTVNLKSQSAVGVVGGV